MRRRDTSVYVLGWGCVTVIGVLSLHGLGRLHLIEDPRMETLLAAAGQLLALAALMLIAYFHSGSPNSQGDPDKRP